LLLCVFSEYEKKTCKSAANEKVRRIHENNTLTGQFGLISDELMNINRLFLNLSFFLTFQLHDSTPDKMGFASVFMLENSHTFTDMCFALWS